jgi:hypothetical protein
LGIGDWGLGIGDWAQSPIPNPQSPIPNPHLYFSFFRKIIKIINYTKNNILNFYNNFFGLKI